MKKSVVILFHVAFWLIVLGTTLMGVLSFSHIPPSNPKFDQWMRTTSYYSIIIGSYPISFYAGYFGIAKLLKKKYFAYYAAFAIIVLYSSLFLLSNYQKEFLLVTGNLSAIILFSIIGIFSYYFIDWFQKRNKILLLEKQNTDSNLALLRTQINPHFLFNTLHNIDALIMNNQEKASKSLIKLSDIMRYMLHESQSDFVPLEKELEYIKNYISLEELRIKNPGFLNFTISGDYYKEIKVAPMLFLPFIENAFKHSVDSDCENGIMIEFVIDRNNITFICRNIYDKTDTNRDETHGIGLDTVKKRLELIYPDKHKLVIEKNDASFDVELKITMNEN